jgi:hypothetical protein
MKIRLITVIWGAPFVDLFLKLSLRSLMADGNIAALAKAHDCHFTIFTTKEDLQTLESAPDFIKLSEIVHIDISIFGLGEIDPANRGHHAIMWERAFELARRNKEILFLIIPYLLYAEGTLLRWAKKIKNGAREIYTPGQFVALERAP